MNDTNNNRTSNLLGMRVNVQAWRDSPGFEGTVIAQETPMLYLMNDEGGVCPVGLHRCTFTDPEAVKVQICEPDNTPTPTAPETE